MQQRNETNASFVTVVVSTCNRGDAVLMAVESILANNYPFFEVRVVDQSDDDVTETALRPIFSDHRLCYLRTPTKGLAVGHNRAIQDARGELIAITDDDCVVPPDWIHQMERALLRDNRIGVVFGNVDVAAFDPAKGFIPGCSIVKPTLAKSPFQRRNGIGIGACMGIRRSTWTALSGFDEALGPGATFKSGEETDFGMRALVRGFYVYETPQVTLVHHGFRSWGDASRNLAYRNWYGVGAVIAKMLRCGYWLTLPIIVHMAFTIALGDIVRNLLARHRPLGVTSAVACYIGIWAGLVARVDRKRGHFVLRAL